MRSIVLVAVAATLLAPAVATAQVATSAPQRADPARSPSGSDQPLTKPNNTGVPVPHNRLVARHVPRAVTEDAAFKAEQRRDDRGMNICIGCD